MPFADVNYCAESPSAKNVRTTNYTNSVFVSPDICKFATLQPLGMTSYLKCDTYNKMWHNTPKAPRNNRVRYSSFTHGSLKVQKDVPIVISII